MSSNTISVYDEDGDTPDWIEIKNTGTAAVNLEGVILTDSANVDTPWSFPSMTLGAGQHLLVFASAKDRREPPMTYETIIDWGDSWRYVVPDGSTSVSWKDLSYDDSGWSEGTSGFGYGDDDDNTVLPGIMSVFMRKEFVVQDPTDIQEILLHVDYDDAFVAYINGVEVARENITSTGPPAFDQAADNFDHEAAMYGGGQPNLFTISNPQDFLIAGTNVIAIQGHNHSTGSSDFTLIPFVTLGRNVGVSDLSEHLSFTTNFLHANFKISSSGEYVQLSTTAGELIDQLFTGEIPTDISIGRNPDGTGSFQYFGTPTPGAENSGDSFTSIASDVSFSEPAGFKQASFQLTLSAPDGDEILYSLDGSHPSEGQLYTGPITISSTSSVSAINSGNNLLPGRVTTQSYLFGSDHDVPVVSITIDPDHLWDENTGIYASGPNASPNFPHFGANFWEDWERPIQVELFETDGTQAFSESAGVKIFGGWSRGFPQKSLSVFFRNSYGSDELNYQLFPQMELSSFSSFVLRNSGNDWLNTMFRDALASLMFSENVDQQAYRPAVLYLNGQYWGIQNIREKVNEDFLANHHDLNADDITIVETNAIPVEGDPQEYIDLINFVSSNSLSGSANYEFVADQIDLDNFIDYFIGQIFVDNRDWPGNNIKYWKSNAEGSKWRWIGFDRDFGFAIWDPNAASFNTLAHALEPNGPGWPNPPWSTLLFRKMTENDEFRDRFIVRFLDRLNTDYRAENIQPKIDSLQNLIVNEIGDHMNRWGGDLNAWNQNVNQMRSFATNRAVNVREHLRTQFGQGFNRLFTVDVSDEMHGYIRINTVEPPSFPWSGSYFQGLALEVEAIPLPGYEFAGWQGDVVSNDRMLDLTLTANTSLTANFISSTGDGRSLVISEINYVSSAEQDTKDWIEFYNNSSATIDISGWRVEDEGGGVFTMPAGTTVTPRDFLVVCRDLTSFTQFHSASVSIGDMTFGLSSTGDCVRLFDDEDAMVDEVCYTAVAPWPTGDPAGTLALKSAFADNSLPSSWLWSVGFGSPGADHFLDSGVLSAIRTESVVVHPNPTSGFVTVKTEWEGTLTVTDLAGKVILHVPSRAGRNTQLDMASYPDGLYLLKVSNGLETAVRKVVKR